MIQKGGKQVTVIAFCVMSSISNVARTLRKVGVLHQRLQGWSIPALRRCVGFSFDVNAAPRSAPTLQQTLHTSVYYDKAWRSNESTGDNVSVV